MIMNRRRAGAGRRLASAADLSSNVYEVSTASDIRVSVNKIVHFTPIHYLHIIYIMYNARGAGVPHYPIVILLPTKIYLLLH